MQQQNEGTENQLPTIETLAFAVKIARKRSLVGDYEGSITKFKQIFDVMDTYFKGT
jgi:hypothetical protein